MPARVVELAPVDLAQNKSREKSHGCARTSQRIWGRERAQGGRDSPENARHGGGDCGQPGGDLARVSWGFWSAGSWDYIGGEGTGRSRINRNESGWIRSRFGVLCVHRRLKTSDVIADVMDGSHTSVTEG